MQKKLLLAILILPFIFSGCKKDSDPSKTELLTNRNWVLTALTVDPSIPLASGGTTTNLYNQLKSCAKDNITIFKADKSITFDEGGTKCEVSDPQTQSGTWTFNTTETVISYTANGVTRSETIKSLTSNKLTTTYQDVLEGVTYTLDATYEVK